MARAREKDALLIMVYFPFSPLVLDATSTRYRENDSMRDGSVNC
jgi:hypothetical protein